MKNLNFIEYNRSIKYYARENRKVQTRQEWILWNLVLKHKKCLWYKFLRQKPIWSFIIDFYCSKLLLWIEVDGWYHNERQDYDKVRDSEIYKNWIKIVRFTNIEIDKNLEWVIDCLHDIIKDRAITLWI